MLRGNNRRRLFSFNSDFRRFLVLLERALPKADASLQALCLMANHVHLVVTPRHAASLALLVQRTAQAYARYRNDARETSGKLFEERFFSRALVDDLQLAICTAYVELNPVRAGVVEAPEHYRWSTYRVHAGLEAKMWVPRAMLSVSPWYQGLAADETLRAQRYRDWVDSVRAEDRRPDAVPRLRDGKQRRPVRPDGSSAV